MLNIRFHFNLNDNFRKWFGESVLKDENNLPYICYHKSRSKELFNQFILEGDIQKNPFNNHFGIYFVHQNYADYVNYLGDGVEYYVYLKIEKPFYIYDQQDYGVDCEGNHHRPIDITKNLIDSVSEKNYDGIIIKGKYYDQYIVWNNSQIKSIDNNGEYQGDNLFN